MKIKKIPYNHTATDVTSLGFSSAETEVLLQEIAENHLLGARLVLWRCITEGDLKLEPIYAMIGYWRSLDKEIKGNEELIQFIGKYFTLLAVPSKPSEFIEEVEKAFPSLQDFVLVMSAIAHHKFIEDKFEVLEARMGMVMQ